MCLISEVLALPSERSRLSLALRAHHSPLRLVEAPDKRHSVEAQFETVILG
jgi:hypothetical protein